MVTGCQPGTSKEDTTEVDDELPFRPHILWLVTEDMGPYIPAFGDSTTQTPNLSRLAAEGIRYPNLFSPSGVCAPSRAAIAMGLYPSSFGANHMRTSSHREFTGLPAYEAVPPPEAKMMSQVLREDGYYCTNNLKKDYQFQEPVTAWDESGPFAHWRNRDEGQPFFSIFNFTETHESGLFEPYGFRHIEQRHYNSGDTTFDTNAGSDNIRRGRMREEETTVHVPKDLDFPIPPYLPDTELVRRDLWKMYNNIAEMDRQLGAILDQLEADGLLDSTIIFFYADHGGPLPRQKRLIYDSGLNSPMIIRFPKGWKAGSIDKQLLSFVDFAPTVLSLAGINPPNYLHGQAFLGDHQATDKRDYIYAAADRFDEFTDAIRAVRDPQFKYIRNYRPEQGYYLPISYREQIPSMQQLREMYAEGTLNEDQAQWFREGKPPEELFDCKNDPHELHNLADDPQYAEKLATLRFELDEWLETIGDQPNLPERELVEQLWKGSNEQPVTAIPVITTADQRITISCSTPGANIGYQLVSNKIAPDSWKVYTAPFTLSENESIRVQAHRIGYQPSEVIEGSL
ncbi:MAG: sulfatase-like hydrolase/transferase [Tunicatimonas sp.]